MTRNPADRVAIENIIPSVDGGAFPARRVVGDSVRVQADVFAEGTNWVGAAVAYRASDDAAWSEAPMTALGNDRWAGSFPVDRVGEFGFRVRGWVDRFRTWRDALQRRIEAESVEPSDVFEGIAMLRAVARRGRGAGRGAGPDALGELETAGAANPLRAARELARPDFLSTWDAAGAVSRAALAESEIRRVQVDPARAGHSAWYEVFPRSTSPDATRPGTLRDLRARLPYIAEMGFDVVYLPPIHPIGSTGRRGPNNAPYARPGDPGSPWAIGSAAGGHTSVAPELGTLDDFRALVRAARERNMDVALDLAFQCSPDHPWVREHPAWFRHRPDGSIRTAENPPKKYDDIYPFDFETPEREALWAALRDVVEFWIRAGVRWFRVDNPHTKPFPFWEWLIGEVRRHHPDVLFLAEAFTRPKVMYRLAKIGFTHSYTYFTWRTSERELREYFGELGTPPVSDFFRPHLWPNTPDILPVHLQAGGAPAFKAWLVLAATLSPHYGVYGPTFELVERRAAIPGREEYLDSEKYQVRHWNLDSPHSLRDFVARVNRIRRDHPTLEGRSTLVFHGSDNPALLTFSRRLEGASEAILVFVNLDPVNTQSGWTNLDLAALGLSWDSSYEVHDLLTDRRYTWRGGRNYVELRPREVPAHIFAVPVGGRGRAS